MRNVTLITIRSQIKSSVNKITEMFSLEECLSKINVLDIVYHSLNISNKKIYTEDFLKIFPRLIVDDHRS